MEYSEKKNGVHLDRIDAIEDGIRPNNAIDAYRARNPREVAEIEKRLLRKLDLRIMPVVVLIYIFNYARLYGIEKDTHVSGATWNTAIAIFNVGYIAMQIPSTLLIPRVKPSIFLPACMIVWAIVSGCTAATNSPASLLIVRFALGIVEAPFFPCAVFYLSCWYKKTELGKRVALLASGMIISSAFAGLLSAAILSGMKHVHVLSPWRWLFIIEGMATLLIATAAILLLPDYPANTSWLSAEEKEVAQARLAIDIGSDDVLDEAKIGMLKSLRQAAKDYRVWFFASMHMACIASTSYSHFFPTLVQSLGFKSVTMSLLLTSPPYVVSFFYAIGMAYAADRKQTRSPFAGISVTVAIVGGIMAVSLPTNALSARYGAMFLLVSGTCGISTTTYTWLSSTITQPPAKRSAAIGIANSFASLAGFYSNYFWLDKFEPRYTQSWCIVMAFLALCACSIMALRLSLCRSNKNFERLSEQHAQGELDLRELTDDEQRAVRHGFRFVI